MILFVIEVLGTGVGIYNVVKELCSHDSYLYTPINYYNNLNRYRELQKKKLEASLTNSQFVQFENGFQII